MASTALTKSHSGQSRSGVRDEFGGLWLLNDAEVSFRFVRDCRKCEEKHSLRERDGLRSRTRANFSRVLDTKRAVLADKYIRITTHYEFLHFEHALQLLETLGTALNNIRANIRHISSIIA